MSFAATTNPVLSSLSGLRDTGVGDLGGYFTARNPTLGTGLTGTTSVNTFVETTPSFVLYNAGPLNIYPMSLQTHLTVVGVNAGAVLDWWTFTTDVGNRYASGGTQLVAVNDNGNTFANSGAFIMAGGVTATAATPVRRIVANVQSKTDVIEVVHDTQFFSWGDTFGSSVNAKAANAASPAYNGFSFPPLVIAPGTSLVIVRWAPNQTTGSTHEYQFTWVEK
jgi:hypothetical protein